MKIINFLFYINFMVFIPLSEAFSQQQGGTWTWVNGDSVVNSNGVYGTRGVASANNHPPGEYEPIEWKDKQGNFWIYGGTYPFMSDLWKYNPITNEWAWVKGSGGVQNLSAIYGTQGVPDSLNTPGARSYATPTWVDTSGNLWLFGGIGCETCGQKNDLWKYDIFTNEWTWMKGDSTPDEYGVHGIQGIPSFSNNPGSRNETSSAWTDSLNNLWLFGGSGYGDTSSGYGYLNDLCKYDISTNEWTWMKGSANAAAPAVYGTKGIANANNDPGGRWSYTKWKDLQGNFWLMGGATSTSGFNNATANNDVWKYDLSVNEWTWMNGPNTFNNVGNYPLYTRCVFDTTVVPDARYEQRSSVTDNCGRFWLFGGLEYGWDGLPVNDLLVFDPQVLGWNWLSGTYVGSQTGSYGSINFASPTNMPPSRFGAVAWWGNDNKLYIFGGSNSQVPNQFGCFSDVWVFNPDTDCVPLSCSSVTYPAAIALFNISSYSDAHCAGTCLIFNDMSYNATSWQWLFPGATDSMSTSQNPPNICYPTAGKYNVTLIVSNSTGSDTLTKVNYVNITRNPPTPVLTQRNDTLVCSTDPSYTYYKWYLDSTLISEGYTDSLLVITQAGDYKVEVIGYGCGIEVGMNIILGIQNYANNNMLSLSPNPAANQLTIHTTSFHNEAVMVSVLNVLGQEISPQESGVLRTPPAPLEGERGDAVIDVSKLSAGIYFLQLKSQSGSVVKMFVKE